MELNNFIQLVEYQIEYQEGKFPYLLARVHCEPDGNEVRLHISSQWLFEKGKWIIKSENDLQNYKQDEDIKDFVETYVSWLFMTKAISTQEHQNDFDVEIKLTASRVEKLVSITRRMRQELKENRSFQTTYA
jgi:hypothetical protein